MAEVILSQTAYADLAEIGDYSEAQFGRDAADSYQDAIDHAFERLGSFPHSGAARPDFGRDVRCIVCNRHRILYRVSGDRVRILRILHHLRDVPRHLPT